MVTQCHGKVVGDVVIKFKDELHLPCTCERCLDDVMALRSSRRVITNDHSPYIRASHEADRQGATNILTTVAKAASIVARAPRCGFVCDSVV